MAKLHKISLGSEMFLARSGQRVLDAALLNGVEMPHDCRAGRCGTCLTRVKTGITLGGETARIRHALDHQATGPPAPASVFDPGVEDVTSTGKTQGNRVGCSPLVYGIRVEETNQHMERAAGA